MSGLGVLLFLIGFSASQASHCGSLKVELYLDALLNQGELAGIYQSSYPVNGKPSWTSETSDIFYNPILKAWAIGDKSEIGYKNGRINSKGDPEKDDPQNVVSWTYWNNHDWVDSPSINRGPSTENELENEIIVECVEDCNPLEEYCYYNAEVSPNQASTFCKSMGRKLFEPRYLDQNMYVARMAGQMGISQFWIGINWFQEGVYKYDSNDEEVQFQNWKDGEPMGWVLFTGHKYCIAIDVTTGGDNFNYLSKWIADYRCLQKKGFVCEKTESESLSEAEIIQLIEAHHESGILSEDEIIQLIEAQDNCQDNPCKSGYCIDLKNDYRCNCHSGYAGRNCDLPCPVENELFHIVDGTCLRIDLERKNYNDAQETCENEQVNGFTTGRLWEPKTLSFNDKVFVEYSSVSGSGSASAWIGIKAKGGFFGNGKWVYTSTGEELGFENWASGQPGENQKCVYFGWSGPNFGKWGDHFCTREKFSICEFGDREFV